MTKKYKAGKKRQTTVLHKNVEFRTGDCLIINPDADAAPYLAKVTSFLCGKYPSDIEVEVVWFYRPEELKHGRKAFHGEKEILVSDHQDRVHIHTVLGKCYVHSLEEFVKLSVVNEDDFFTRFAYEAVTSTYVPQSVPVYCFCRQPYNPDREMLYCSYCQDWYHLECAKSRRRHGAAAGNSQTAPPCAMCGR